MRCISVCTWCICSGYIVHVAIYIYWFTEQWACADFGITVEQYIRVYAPYFCNVLSVHIEKSPMFTISLMPSLLIIPQETVW